MADTSFGEALRLLRRETGHSLADLADAWGCSISYVSEVERGRKNPPNTEKIEKLLAFMGQEHRLAEFLLQAARSRRRIEINVEGKDDEIASMLVALERRCDEGKLDDETVKAIRLLRRKLEGGAD